MDLSKALSATISADQAIRTEATEQLRQLREQDFGAYMTLLSREFHLHTSAQSVRMAAGLAFKNAIHSRAKQTQDLYTQRWYLLPSEVRDEVKSLVYRTLEAEDQLVANISAQVVANIATMELPNGEWTDLLPSLLAQIQVNNSQDSVGLRRASLQALGYICEHIEPRILVSYSDRILTALINSIKTGTVDESVRLAALNGLCNSLEFVNRNFQIENERNFIMQVVCEATQDSQKIRIKALECLVKIAALYYDLMPHYMDIALLGITVSGMNSQDEMVVLQSVEFWSTLAELESDIDQDNEYFSSDVDKLKVNYQFVRGALDRIVPILLAFLSNQDEEADEGDWNVSRAASTCLSLIALNAKDGCVPHVMSFVEGNVKHQDWRLREASVMAFGCILDGPGFVYLAPYVRRALPTIVDLLNDNNELVKDTSAWTIGRICEYFAKVVFESPDATDAVLCALCKTLFNVNEAGNNDEQRKFVTTCAWALINLAKHVDPNDQLEPPYYVVVVAQYQNVTNALWNGSLEESLPISTRTALLECLSTWIVHSPQKCLDTVFMITMQVLKKLEVLVAGQNPHALTSNADTVASYCRIISAIINRAGKNVLSVADQIMTGLLMILNANLSLDPTTKEMQSVVFGSSLMVEDCLVVVSSMALVLEGEFRKYANPFIPFLVLAIRNHENHQLCAIGIALLADLARALGNDLFVQLQSYEPVSPNVVVSGNNMNWNMILGTNDVLDVLVRIMLAEINNTYLHGDLPCPLINTFADLISASTSVDPNQSHMLCYLLPVYEAIAKFMKVMVVKQPIVQNFEDMPQIEDSDAQVRLALIEFAAIIMQAFVANSTYVVDLLPDIMALLLATGKRVVLSLASSASVIIDEEDDNLIRAVLGLVGDLATTFSHINRVNLTSKSADQLALDDQRKQIIIKAFDMVAMELANNWVHSLINEARQHRNKARTKATAKWAREKVRFFRNNTEY